MKYNSKKMLKAKSNGVSLIIPVLNEEKTLENIIERCLKQDIVRQLIVVNDGSTDNTKKVLNSLKRNKKYKTSKLTVIHHPSNLGKGAAIKTGLKEATQKYVMIQDADLEYFPEEIVKLYKEAEKKNGGIIFGTRTRGKNKGYLLAQLGNWYLNTMFNFLFGYELTDSYTCYKLISNKIWRESNLKSNGFEIDSELVAKLGLKGYKISEVPISYNPRKYAEGKKIKWTDLVKASLTAIKVRFGRI